MNNPLVMVIDSSRTKFIKNPMKIITLHRTEGSKHFEMGSFTSVVGLEEFETVL